VLNPTANNQGRYFQDLLEQGQAVERTYERLAVPGLWESVQRFVHAHSNKRIVLTGMGSSFHTLHPLNLALIEAGHSPVMMETSELIHYGQALCDAQTLIVAVSQSGSSAEIVRLLDLKGKARTLAITNTENSPLAKRADLSLLIQAGPEFSVSCKTYVAGMLALQWLAALFTEKSEVATLAQLKPAARMVDEYIQRWPQHVSALTAKLADINHLFLAGRGRSLAAVGTGALITKESARFHAEGMSSAAFRHGPMEMLRKDMFTVVFSGDTRTRELNQRLLRDLLARGLRCEEIGATANFAPFRLPSADPVLQPILEILPVEMMTLALASLTGHEAGRFEYASKITDTE
jgi:glucosamine--fructose-6-phosphate aminotransferase (isomerizing)